MFSVYNANRPQMVRSNSVEHHLAKLGSERPFIGSESAYSASMGVAKKAVRDWTIGD
jgi:hypothetical protein